MTEMDERISRMVVVSGHAVNDHARELGLNVPQLLGEMTTPGNPAHGVELPTPAARIRERMEQGRTILITFEGCFVAFASFVELAPGYQELSTVMTHPDFRSHGVARRLLYPAAMVHFDRHIGGRLIATTKNKRLVSFGEAFDLEPRWFGDFPEHVLEGLCTTAPCFVPGGKNGLCLNARRWPIGLDNTDPAIKPCWTRVRQQHPHLPM